MRSMISTIAAALTLVLSTAALANPADFDRVIERARMLKLAGNLPQTELRLVLNGGTPQQIAFLNHFRDRIWPRLSELKKQENLFEIWMVAVDRALFDSDKEAAQWRANMVTAQNALDTIMGDPSWADDLRTWAAMAQNLTGELPTYALSLARQMEIESNPPAAIPLLQRLNEVMAEVQRIRNTSPKTATLAAAEKATQDTIARYFAGELTFDEAWPLLEAQVPNGRGALGHDVAVTARDLLNEAAILRTRIAQAKGYNNWAELVLARQASRYAAGSRTPEERIRFLNGILDSTRQPYLEYLERSLSVVQSANRPALRDLRPSMLSLLGNPGSSLIKDYFPLERIKQIWEESMIESGASPYVLSNINLDLYPRDKKQTHAYMANLTSKKPHVVRAHAANLSLVPENQALWNPARIFIVQNNRADGPQYMSTMFHEGGHAMDYSHRENPIPTREETEGSNAWSETHSMTMERFVEDVEFLTARGRTRDGVALSRELAERYISTVRIAKLLRMRNIAEGALYDLELWNHAYTADGESFVDRAHGLRLMTMQRASQVEAPIVGGVDPGYNGFVTDHFTGGQVRYIGYVYAEMAAQLSAEHLWDLFEQTTGRRTLYKQPALIRTLRDAYYRNGFREEFPRQVERFTGKPFSPESLVSGMVDAVSDYHPEPVVLKPRPPGPTTPTVIKCPILLIGDPQKPQT